MRLPDEPAANEFAAERELARIASSQHGLVTRSQLLAAGFSAPAIQRRRRRGWLLTEHPGVYRVGHRAPGVEAWYLAAVLACGERARLSGRAAGHLLALIKGAAPAPEVTAPTVRRLAGVITHRSREVDPRDVTRWRGVPVTTVPRTLVDLAAVLSTGALARAVHEADVLHRVDPDQVEAVLRRRPTVRARARCAPSCSETFR